MTTCSLSVTWSPEAEEDLLQIWHYLAREASGDSADRHLRAIDAACRLLAHTPFRGRPRNELRPGLRSIHVEPHLVFYRVSSVSIEIARVLHERRDIDVIFPNA